MNEQTAAPAHGTLSAPVERRVSTVAGHRLCSSCGFTLLGQPILREPHYAMLIIRCPECGAIAAVQEYPALGRWAARWAALLAAIWLVTLVGATLASAGILFGMSEGMLDAATTLYAEEIARAHDLWYKALPDPKASPVAAYMPAGAIVAPGAFSWIDAAWWKSVDKPAFLRAHGGWFGAMDPAAYWFAWWVVLAGLVIGIFWSVALLAARRTRAMLIAAAIVPLAASFCWLAHQGEAMPWVSGINLAANAAEAQFVPCTASLALAIGALSIAAGIWIGRPLVRLAVRTLLPPPMRLPLAGLWITDGLAPPPIRHRS
ncbi:MAG: hypothetical protein IT437_02970 [Phycisphaerales bacterium]|nr:hypothetical protein [Phycisphaerales bacterium]